MALVPFRVSGAAADQDAETRLLQVAGFSLSIVQQPRRSGNLSHLMSTQGIIWHDEDEDAGSSSSSAPKPPDLSQVGLVVWESAWVLAELLLRVNPLGGWAGVRVLELGAGTGVTGMFLARAGAQVVLTDQQHILPLLKHNVARNFLPEAPTHSGHTTTSSSSSHHGWGSVSPPSPPQLEAAPTAAGGAVSQNEEELWQPGDCMDASLSPGSQQQQLVERWGVPRVREYTWGAPVEPLLHSLSSSALLPTPHTPAVPTGAATLGSAAAGGVGNSQQQQLEQQQRGAAGVCFDVIVGADLLYAPQSHAALLVSLGALAAPHTQVYLAHRLRGLGEGGFAEAAAAAGWVVQEAPAHMLQEEYQGGQYQVLLLCKGAA